MRKREVVTCHLCKSVWTAPRGLGREAYRSHYLDEHYVELEVEEARR